MILRADWPRTLTDFSVKYLSKSGLWLIRGSALCTTFIIFHSIFPMAWLKTAESTDLYVDSSFTYSGKVHYPWPLPASGSSGTCWKEDAEHATGNHDATRNAKYLLKT